MMKKVCAVSKKEFEITDADLEFYEKMGVPVPTICPEERQRRRLAHRNERKLYRRKCDLCGEKIISIYPENSPFSVFCQKCWWSDLWDAKSFGRDFDFSKPFFEQFAALQKKVPQCSLCVLNSENSEFCNYVGNVRNCYLVFGPVYSEDCLYGSPYYSKNCVDNLLLRKCEWCYECVDCRKLYECFHCQDCHSSNKLVHCFDLKNCHDCIGCAGLRNKSYCIFNVSYSREDFEKMKKKLDLKNPNHHEKIRQELARLKLEVPHRFMQGFQNDREITGNYIFNSKNIDNSYFVDRCEDCSYCAQIVDLKNCFDNNFTEENEGCVEYLGAYQNKFLHFSKFCNQVSESFYADSCFHSSNLFGCVGMRHAEFCILNKKYSPEEFEKLRTKIVQKMRETGEWGEFFPIEISPFAYNETVAQEYFPLEKSEVLARGWRWREQKKTQSSRKSGEKKSSFLKEDLGGFKIPDSIFDVDEKICSEILACKTCGKNYKIQKSELKFYKKMSLPIPQKCPDCRHFSRMKLRNPRKLFSRKCESCDQKICTTFSPDRPEKVFCEQCFVDAVN
jgi:hypothetical protein